YVCPVVYFPVCFCLVLLLFFLVFFFFFFQAEDGIRDFHVTGVQTCALPIWRTVNPVPLLEEAKSRLSQPALEVLRSLAPGGGARSEERRVGKEWRSRWMSGR